MKNKDEYLLTGRRKSQKFAKNHKGSTTKGLNKKPNLLICGQQMYLVETQINYNNLKKF